MRSPGIPVRPRLLSGTAVAVAVAVMISVAGCGSRATDGEIAAALRDPAAVTNTAGGGLAPGGSVSSDAAQAPAGAVGAEGSAVTDPGAVAGGATPAVQNPATMPGSGGSGSAGKTSDAPARAGGQGNAPAGPATKSPVSIGQIGPFSGVLGAITENAPKTLAMWAAYTNANGGLNGHPVRVIVGDDQGDPATGLTVAKRMVESDRIIAMAGGLNVFGFAQIDQYMRSKNVPMIGDGIDPVWFTSPVSFPVTSHTPIQIAKGLGTFVSAGATKLAMLYCLEVAAICTYLHDQTKKSAVGKYVVQSYQVSLVAPSYTSQCLRMKQAGVEAVMLLMDTAGAARVLQDCANQGFKPKSMLLGLDATPAMPTIPALKDALIPSAVFSPAGGQGVAAIDKFRQVLATYGGGIKESGTGAYAWAAGEMLRLAAKNLPDNPKPADILEGLWKVKNETLGGLIMPATYAKGKNAVVAPCTFIWGVKDNKFSAPQGSKPFC